MKLPWVQPELEPLTLNTLELGPPKGTNHASSYSPKVNPSAMDVVVVGTGPMVTISEIENAFAPAHVASDSGLVSTAKPKSLNCEFSSWMPASPSDKKDALPLRAYPTGTPPDVVLAPNAVLTAMGYDASTSAAGGEGGGGDAAAARWCSEHSRHASDVHNIGAR